MFPMLQGTKVILTQNQLYKLETREPDSSLFHMEADLLTGPLADRLLRVCARHKITSLTCKAYLISTAQLPQSTHLPPNLPSNQSNHKIKDVCRSLQYAKIDWDLKDLDNMPDLNEIVSNVPRILGNHFPRLHNVDMRNVGRGFLGELCQYMHQYMPSTSSLCIEMDSKSLDPDLEWNGFKTLISSQLTSLSLKATVSIPITYIMTDCISSLSAALLTPECQLQTLCLDMRGSILEDHENLGIFSLMLAGTRTLEHLNLTEGSLGLVTTVKALTRGLQHNSTLRKLVLCLQRQDGVDNHDDDDDELCPSYQDLVSVIAKHPRLEKVELRKIFDLSGLQWCVLIWQLIQQCPRVSSLVIRKRSQVNPQIVHPQLINLLTSALSNTNCNLLDFGGIQLTQLPIIKSNHPLVDAIRKRGSLCCFATQTKNPALDHVIAQNLNRKRAWVLVVLSLAFRRANASNLFRDCGESLFPTIVALIAKLAQEKNTLSPKASITRPSPCGPHGATMLLKTRWAQSILQSEEYTMQKIHRKRTIFEI